MKRILALALVAAWGVAAQGAPPSQWGTPVDQSVGDLDLLSTSLRQVSTGLRQNGEQTSLYRVDRAGPGAVSDYDRAMWAGGSVGAMQAVYYRVGPGFRARVDHLDYLVPLEGKKVGFNVAGKRDGAFLEVAPLNTVYELTPLPDKQVLREAATPAEERAGVRDGRVNSRLESRVGAVGDQRVNGRVEGRQGPAKP